MAEPGVAPLSTLLSQALVAFTVEFDNEAEHRLAHRTTDHGPDGAGRGPWLVSMVMWVNCMRFVTSDGVTVAELERLAGTPTNVAGMRRWGYLRVDPGSARAGGRSVRPDDVLQPTRWGQRAQEVWRPLAGEIEERWEARFGVDAVGRLRRALGVVARELPSGLPDGMPILGHGLAESAPARRPTPAGSPPDAVAAGGGRPDPDLAALLARVLVALARDVESGSSLSLAMTANVLRVLDEADAAVRDLPRRTGVSKESLAMALGFLERRALAVTGTGSGRAKVVRLTPRGMAAARVGLRRLTEVQDRWKARLGRATVEDCVASLTPLVGGGTADTSPLFAGLDPYPEGWRAALRRPQTLPHYPMVLHRGGYPDGS